AVAHLGLALTGSAALIIGTLVSNTAWLAALVTIPVAFAIFFAGVASPNAQAGVLGALLVYILPACSPAAASTIGSRLAGWWLASAAGTVAVLLLSPKPPGNKLRARAVQTATALAAYLDGGKAPRLDIDRFRYASAALAAKLQMRAGEPANVRAAAAIAAHAQSIALAAQADQADVLIASGKASPELVEAERSR